MINEIANNLDRFAGDIETFKETVTDIENNLSKVYDGISSLNSMWTGTAHDEFVTQFNTDYEAMREILEMLNKFKGNLDYAKDEYNKCERSVSDLVNSIRV